MRLPISDRNVLCIDWDERSVRIMDVTISRLSLRIHKAVHVSFSPGTDVRDPASLGDFLRRTLAEHRIRTRRAVVDAPRQDAVLTMLSLPKGSVDELAAMVHVQIAKELPFGLDQAVIDFAIGGGEDKPTYDVWVAAVRNHVVEYYQNVMSAAGLKLERIGLRPYANQSAVTAGGVTTGRTLTVDIGPSMTEINVIRDGRLVYSRAASVTVPPGGLQSRPQRPADREAFTGDQTIPLSDDFVPPQAPMDALLIEVTRTIAAYRATDAAAVLDRIILAGTAELDETVQEAFQRRFGVPTSVYEAPKRVQWRRDAGELAAPYSTVLGLALSNVAEQTLHFDFLHPKEPEAGRRERARRRPVIVGAVVVVVLLIGWLIYRPVSQRNQTLAALSSEIKQLQKQAKDRDQKKLMQTYVDLESWEKSNVIWIDEIARLIEVFPSNEEAYITNLECSTNGTITIELAARDRTVGTKLITSIENLTVGGADEKPGKKLFTAEPGEVSERPKDPKYKYADTIIVQIKRLEDKK